MITLPSSAPTDILASTGTIFSDLWGIISVAIGIPLAFFIINLIISLVAKRQEAERFRLETSEASIGLTHAEAEGIALHEQFEEVMEDDDEISIYD